MPSCSPARFLASSVASLHTRRLCDDGAPTVAQPQSVYCRVGRGGEGKLSSSQVLVYAFGSRTPRRRRIGSSVRGCGEHASPEHPARIDKCARDTHGDAPSFLWRSTPLNKPHGRPPVPFTARFVPGIALGVHTDLACRYHKLAERGERALVRAGELTDRSAPPRSEGG